MAVFVNARFRQFVQSQFALRRRFTSLVLIISLLQLSGCDLSGGPNAVERQTETQLLKYFPYAHAIASAEQESIIAVTCTRGLGKAAVEEIGKYLEDKPGIQRLIEARHYPLKVSPYRFFVLAFDEYRIRLDTDTQQRWILPSDTESRQQYERVCGADASFPARHV